MAYLRIAKDSKYSFLFESIIGGENVARYSFIGSGEFSMPPAIGYFLMYSGRPTQGHKDRAGRGGEG